MTPEPCDGSPWKSGSGICRGYYSQRQVKGIILSRLSQVKNIFLTVPNRPAPNSFCKKFNLAKCSTRLTCEPVLATSEDWRASLLQQGTPFQIWRVQKSRDETGSDGQQALSERQPPHVLATKGGSHVGGHARYFVYELPIGPSQKCPFSKGQRTFA